MNLIHSHNQEYISKINGKDIRLDSQKSRSCYYLIIMLHLFEKIFYKSYICKLYIFILGAKSNRPAKREKQPIIRVNCGCLAALEDGHFTERFWQPELFFLSKKRTGTSREGKREKRENSLLNTFTYIRNKHGVEKDQQGKA